MGRKYLKKQIYPRIRIGKDGYPFVTLYKNQRPTTFSVHKLEMLAFVGPRPKRGVIMHKNNIKTDNRLTNLRYGTQSENLQQMVREGRDPKFWKGKFAENNATSRKIYQYDLKGSFIKLHPSIREAAKAVGVTQPGISTAMARGYAAGGFLWSFEDKPPAIREKGNKCKKVLQFDRNGILIKEHDSLREAMTETGISESYISSACNGHAKTAGGFIWKFKEPNKMLVEYSGERKPLIEWCRLFNINYHTFYSAFVINKKSSLSEAFSTYMQSRFKAAA